MTKMAFPVRLTVLAVGAMALTACDSAGNFDFDLRDNAGVLDTSDAVRSVTGVRPEPDTRGVVSYPGYQVAIARRGDTVESVAARVGLPAAEIASYNAIPQGVPLREGEIVALPRRVSEPAPGGPGSLDVTTIAGSAIDRAEGQQGLAGAPAGAEPTRHRVAPGETAFSIARLYDVPVASLAEWNGLGPDLALRVGQYVLIPTRTASIDTIEVASVETPGAGSATPIPPSAAQPLPEEDARPVEVAAAPAPVQTPVATQQTAASDTSRLRMPVQGKIIRSFEKGKNEGIGISAPAGATVVAADGGTVAAITRDTDQVPILVLRHENNLLTVYAGVEDIAVQKGDTVERGQKIAVVRGANPPFLHFEVREGFESVDPDPYLR